MAKYSREQTDGLEVALAIHLGIYCAAAACFALGLYALLQPSRQPNPGLSAYKAPSGMVATYLPSIRDRGEPMPFTNVRTETAKPEAAKQAQAAATQRPAQETTAEPPKRQRAATARKERREPWPRYAEQPMFGGSRPWF
jgi:hypothetical protein